jgi:hypothetical protein
MLHVKTVIYSKHWRKIPKLEFRISRSLLLQATMLNKFYILKYFMQKCKVFKAEFLEGLMTF